MANLQKRSQTRPVLGPTRTTMIARCHNPQTAAYKNYGGRGIIVCKEWREDPKSFYRWGMANGYQKGLQLDRIDNNGNYTPENCRFVTPKINARNKRTTTYLEIDGVTKTVAEWAEENGVDYRNTWKRLKNGVNKKDLFIRRVTPCMIEYKNLGRKSLKDTLIELNIKVNRYQKTRKKNKGLSPVEIIDLILKRRNEKTTISNINM